MTGLDTNVLLAWLLRGHAHPSLPEGPYRISLVVVAELVWLLGRQFRWARRELADTVELLLQTSSIYFDDEMVLARAVNDFREGSADFADYLLMRDNEHAGCAATLTLDKKAAKHPGFTLVTGRA